MVVLRRDLEVHTRWKWYGPHKKTALYHDYAT
jgi:hypothetical protein